MIFSELQQELGKRVLGALSDFYRTHDLGKASMAYSGGLDSSILLAMAPRTVIPYTLGNETSKDYSNSKDGAKKLGFNVVSIRLSSVKLESYVNTVMEIDPGIRKNDLGYEVVLAALLDNMEGKEVITGQGADEVFYGYNIFRVNPGLDNRLHMEKLLRETIPREGAIAEHFGKKLITPYLSGEILKIMKNVDRDTNFSGDINKAVLRSAAVQAGLPPEIAERKKTAAQYGSGLMKMLKKLPIWNTLPQ